ncbi:hypothetical protein [Streptomyces cadmiisoli]|uniref:hypothetical protein n=1 Tax=Streptomyces cadmiisoli TaxID=2184053 RepID=UPI003D703333
MSSLSPSRSPRRISAAGLLAPVAVAVGALVLAVQVSVPEAWWPHTGQVFTAGTRPTPQDRCEAIAGPAKAYCERGTRTTSPSPAQHDAAGTVWRLIAAGAGLAPVVIWRRSATGRGRS